jgi:hypothetical protein
MPKDVQQWIQEGEEIYNGLLGEHREIESQIEELEQKLSAKQADVNRLAAIIGKPPIESTHKLSAQLVNSEVVDTYSNGTMNNIARALNGRLGR